MKIGPLDIQPFGILVLAGCVAGYFVSNWYASKINLDRKHFRSLLYWVLISGFISAHLISMAISSPEELIRYPWKIFFIKNSLSSYGGFLGGTIALLILKKRRALPRLPYVDALVMGLLVGWFFGRLGCSIAHDHPGTHTQFFLAVQYPDGARHDLGFYEWLYTIFLLIMVLALRPWNFRPGVLTGCLSILYAPARFGLDFLRIGEPRFGGLAISQYFSLILLMTGLCILIHIYKTDQNAFRSPFRKRPEELT